jgi:hypothetical protein
MEESRQKGDEQLAQLREEHRVEMDSLEATHASDLSQLQHVKRILAQGHGDEGDIRKDERLKAKAELDELRQRQQDELQELQQEHGRVLSDAKRRTEMELVNLHQIQADEQEQLTRLLDGVKSSVLDVMRVVDEATVDKSTQLTSQDQKLEARERSLGEVEDRLMAESKAASEQQQKVFDLIEGFAERLNKSGVLDALDQMHAREESATSMESILSQETNDLGAQRRDTEGLFSLARRVGESLERSAPEGKTDERERSTQDAEQGLAGDISATNEQQLQITDMIDRLEDKARQGGEREKPSLRGTTTVALPREDERIAADFSVEESAAADAPEQERDPSDAPVENALADAPVEEKDAVDTPAEKSGVTDVPVDERDPTDVPVEERDEANTPAEKSGAVEAPVDERDPADAPVEQSSAADASADESGPADAPVEQSGVADAAAEAKDAADAPAEESGASDAAAEEKDAADAPAEERGPADAPAEQSGAADAVNEESDAAGAPAETTTPPHSFYASSANALVEAWNRLHPEDQIPIADAMVKPGVAYRRKAEEKHPVPAIRMDLQRPYTTSAAGEFLAKSSE